MLVRILSLFQMVVVLVLGMEVLTPKFGKESDLWVQRGEEFVRQKEGFLR
jgi:hypothetical protein